MSKGRKGQAVEGYVQDSPIYINFLNMQKNTIRDLGDRYTSGKNINKNMRMLNATFKTAVTPGKQVGHSAE